MPLIDPERPARSMVVASGGSLVLAVLFGLLAIFVRNGSGIAWAISAVTFGPALLFLGGAIYWGRGRGDREQLRRRVAELDARNAMAPEFENNPRRMTRRLRSRRAGRVDTR